MLPCSGDDFTVSHDLDPLGDDILTAVGRYLDVCPSSIALKVRQHFGASIVVLDAADLGLLGVHSSGELVDAASGLGKALVGGSGVVSHH